MKIPAICWLIYFLLTVAAVESTSAFGLPKGSRTEVVRRADPKCAFLREEYARVKRESEAFKNDSPFKGVARESDIDGITLNWEDYIKYLSITERYSAQQSILWDKIISCGRNQKLSSPDRLPSIELLRQKHINRFKRRWQDLTGTADDDRGHPVLDSVNVIYDEEGKSFYNRDPSSSQLDPDILKDFPNLLAAVNNSNLAAEHKTFLLDHARFLRYEEAGRLYNILMGIDLDKTIGYAYSLRQQLVDRARKAQLVAEQESTRISEARLYAGGIT